MKIFWVSVFLAVALLFFVMFWMELFGWVPPDNYVAIAAFFAAYNTSLRQLFRELEK